MRERKVPLLGRGMEGGTGTFMFKVYRGEGEGVSVYGGQLGAGFDAVEWMLPW